MKIKHQLIILGSLSLMAILAVLASSTYFTRHAENLSSAMAQLGKLEVTLLNLRRNEKDFLLRKDEKYLDKFNENAALFLDQKQQLDQTLYESGVKLPNQLEQELASYRDTFTRLVTAYKQLGLSYQSGLLGQFMTELDKQIMSQPSVALVELERAVLSGSELTVAPTGIAT
ncbi:methyl-accepting chemotaxis protein [Vibrio maritimus]|uniref:Methyl-accepting chemotaxis protein n=1 Tax=Vibrio maritimus TaxID=990268 RepID=A0A090RS70_9VIBR|nr:methyl-accepting chemotaxis protein [Vibrio maritimus]